MCEVICVFATQKFSYAGKSNFLVEYYTQRAYNFT